MKKLFCLFAAVAVSVLFASYASADLANPGGTTALDRHWEWRALYGDENSAISPGQAGYAYNDFADGHGNKGHYIYGDSQREDMFAQAAKILDPKATSLGWGIDPRMGWISVADSGFADNGFYAFRNSFDLVEAISSYSFNFTGKFFSDDQIVAIFINGIQLDFTTDPSNALDLGFNGWSEVMTTYVATGTLGNELLVLNQGANYVDFIVRNNDRVSDGGNPKPNAVGLNGKWELVATPEPATFAMLGLGLCGLPFVRRLRKK